MIQVTASVISNIEVMPASRLVWLESPRIAATARPGQFVMVRCGEDTLLRRPLSIHQVDGSKIALLFSIVGKGTRWLSQRQTGDSLDIFGPLGNGFMIQPKTKNILLAAGGIGLAPLAFLADISIAQGKKVMLLYGTANKHQYPESYLPGGIELYTATEDGSKGKKGLVTDLLFEFIDWADQIFACGPIGMYHDMAYNYSRALKNKPVQLSLEIMMGCGAGVCYGCTIKTKSGLKQVCKDGPVFELEDIIWEKLSPI